MTWIIDGNNLLGRVAGDARLTVEAKRELIKQLAQFARERRVRVACYFDGPEPPFFARTLGGVSVVFSGPKAADDLIVQRVADRSDWKLVTSDRTLAARAGGRRVEVIPSPEFIRTLQALEAQQAERTTDTGDWEAYFSDPKNRNV